ncbi:MAG: hypothetical protein ACJ8BW_08595 [Ktedonobacteraceae bacterium]
MARSQTPAGVRGTISLFSQGISWEFPWCPRKSPGTVARVVGLAIPSRKEFCSWSPLL